MKNQKRSLMMSIKTLRVPFVMNDAEVAGTPDISFHSRRLAIFIRTPSQTNSDRVVLQDQRIRRKLQRQGWRTTVISTTRIARNLVAVKLRLAKKLGVRLSSLT